MDPLQEKGMVCFFGYLRVALGETKLNYLLTFHRIIKVCTDSFSIMDFKSSFNLRNA